MIRRFNIQHLYEQGKRIIPWKVILHYRYITFANVKVNVYGTTYDNGIKVLCNDFLIRTPDDGLQPPSLKMWFTTDVFVMTDKNITGMWIEIDGYENIELKNISVVAKQGIQAVGRSCLDDGIYVDPTDGNGIKILSFVINDGSIFSSEQTVFLNNVCSGNPTYYRASRYDTFEDTTWKTYSTNPTFELYAIGINRIYLQVKNDTDISDIAYREVAWHGTEEVHIVEIANIGVVVANELVVVSYPVINSNVFDENALIGLVDITDSITVIKV